MTINLTGTVLASILFEHSNSICDKEGLVLGKISSIVTDTISDSSLNNVEHQTMYHVHSFVHCERLFSWYNGRGEVQADALTEILAKYNSEDVVGWYKLRQNSSLVPSTREISIHRHLEGWMKRRNASRRLIFFLCVSNSTHNGALYTTDHQFMIQDGTKFQNMAINIVNLGNISKPNYQKVSNFTCSADSAYDSIVKRSRSNFVNGKNELSSVKQVDALKSTLHDQLKTICVKLIKSEAELEKEATEVRRLRLQVQSIEDQGRCERRGKMDADVGAIPEQNTDQMEVEDDDDKPLMVFDDDDDGVTDLGVVNRGNESGVPGVKSPVSTTSSVNHLHLLDENSEALDAIRLLDDNDYENDATAIKRQKQGSSKEKEPFEFLTDIFDAHSVPVPTSSSSSSSHELRSQMTVSPEPDLKSGIGRIARRTRGPRPSKTEPDVPSNSSAYGGPAERTRKKVYGRDEN